MYVFDLDGTLIDSNERHYTLMRNLIIDAGWEVPDNFTRAYMEFKAEGHSGQKYLEDILHMPPAVAADVQLKWIADIESASMLMLDKLYEDAIPLLEILKEQNKQIMFLTMRQDSKLLLEELQRLKISAYPCKVAVLPPTGQQRKGDILKQLTGSVDYVIGDTETDYEAARQVGAASYMLNRGFRSKVYWNRMNVKSFTSLHDFIKLIGGKYYGNTICRLASNA